MDRRRARGGELEGGGGLLLLAVLFKFFSRMYLPDFYTVC